MKAKRILTVLLIFIAAFCMATSAFAYGSGYTPAGLSPYGTPYGTTSQSPYQSSGSSGNRSPYTGSSSGNGSPYTGPSSGGMPGSGSSGGNSSTGGMPGSGNPSSNSSSGHTSGMSSNGGSSGNSTSSSGNSHTDNESSGSEYFNASIDSNGSLTLSVPTASGTGTNSAPNSLSSSISLILQKYKNIGTVILGVCVITSILCLLWQITKLGAAGDNQRSRSMAIKGILISGAAIAIFGSLTLVAGIFWGVFA